MSPATHPQCDALLPQVSRTFALPIQALPGSLRGAVQTAYLLCRLVDCVEDQPGLAPVLRASLFDTFDDALERRHGGAFQTAAAAVQLGGSAAERALCRHAQHVFADFRALPARQQEALVAPIEEMSRGMRGFSARGDQRGSLAVSDTDELERYCYFVAGTVGLLLDALFHQQSACHLPAAQRPPMAVQFGIGLQLVNILKDVAEDAERGVCYLPAALLEQHGTSAGLLLSPEHRPAGQAVIRVISALAWANLRRGAVYTVGWSGTTGHPVRAFCALPLLLAADTLRLIERGDGVLMRGRDPRISRRRVAALVSAVRLASGERRMRMLLHHHGLLGGEERLSVAP